MVRVSWSRWRKSCVQFAAFMTQSCPRLCRCFTNMEWNRRWRGEYQAEWSPAALQFHRTASWEVARAQRLRRPGLGAVTEVSGPASISTIPVCSALLARAGRRLGCEPSNRIVRDWP